MDYVVLLSLICIIFIILLFYSGRIKRPKPEHFEVEKRKVNITPGINNFLIDREAVEKCDILDYGNYLDPEIENDDNDENGDKDDNEENKKNKVEDSKIYVNMRNVLEAGRIKKFKPKDRTTLDNKNKEYCFIYDDPIADLQDKMMINKECNIHNVLFKDNPMISDVFVDNKQDNVYKLPYRKCVLEIDKKNVNRENLVTFYKHHDGNMSCDDKIFSLIQKVNIKTKEYVALYKKYKNLQKKHALLKGAYEKLISDLDICFKEREKLIKELEDLISDKKRNAALFAENTLKSKECNKNFKSAENIRDVYMQQKTTEKEEANLNLSSAVQELNLCNKKRDELYPDKNRYIHTLTESTQDVRVTRDDNLKFVKELAKCQDDLSKETERMNDFDKKNSLCFPYIEDAANCKRVKTKCDIDLTDCNVKKDVIWNKSEIERGKHEKCSKDLPPNITSRDICYKQVDTLMDDNKQKKVIIDNNDETISGLWKDVKQCGIDLGRVNEEIKGMQQINTDLYNELGKTNKLCANDTIENINTQIKQVTLENQMKTELVLKEAVVTRKEEIENEIKESVADCKLGMYNCLKGDAVNYDTYIIDSAGGRIEDAQYCAEACAKDTRCRSIYFNESEKKCFKLSGPFETTTTTGIKRSIGQDVLGYTANFDGNTRSQTCPQGAMNCMHAVGISTKDNIVINEKSAITFDDCVKVCHETENCKSVSYSKEMKTCKLFNNFYSEHNENLEPVRYSDNKYMSADIDTGFCESSEWTEWGPCVEINFCTGVGVSERTRSAGGPGCPEVKMSRPCDIPFKRTEAEVEKWTDCSVQCGPGPGTRTKFKNRCNDDIITESCKGEGKIIRSEAELGKWQKCSVECGVGVNVKFDDRCSTIPSETRECVRNFELWAYEDDWFESNKRSFSCSQMENLGGGMFQTGAYAAGFGMSSFRFEGNPGYKVTPGVQGGWKDDDGNLNSYRNYEATDLGDVGYSRSVVWLPPENL